MRIIAFFSNKQGVGTTNLVYHLAWMFAELGERVLAVDLDPQANLTNRFLSYEQQGILFEESTDASTIYRAFKPLAEGEGEISPVKVQTISSHLFLIAGDLALSTVEETLGKTWARLEQPDEASCKIQSGIWRILETAGKEIEADLILIDVGQNLGSLTRTVLLGADDIIFPLNPDRSSCQNLRNIGPALKSWRNDWQHRAAINNSSFKTTLPGGTMRPVGYLVLFDLMIASRGVRSYRANGNQIPRLYQEFILEGGPRFASSPAEDTNYLGGLKGYLNLLSLSLEARKPMFLLRAADGALGSAAEAVSDCYAGYKQIAKNIRTRVRN